jgi:hypothetical protein
MSNKLLLINIHSVTFATACREVVLPEYNQQSWDAQMQEGQVTMNAFPFLKNSWVQYWKRKWAGCHHASNLS